MDISEGYLVWIHHMDMFGYVKDIKIGYHQGYLRGYKTRITRILQDK